MIDIKDIIEEEQLGDGFLLFRNAEGFYIGFVQNGKLEIYQRIDRQAFNVIQKSHNGGGR